MTSTRTAKSYTLAEIAARLGGEVVGDAGACVDRVATLESAANGAITFLANARYAGQLEQTRASAVILGAAARELTGLPRIVCTNPYAYFARVSALLNPPPAAPAGVHATAVVDPDARIAADASIGPLVSVGRGAAVAAGCVVGPGCVIGENVRIGRNTRLNGNVTIYAGCILGDDVIVHAGVVIGGDGFGIAWDEGRWVKVPQIGRVVIGNDVEIGANTTIDRGALDDTVIEDGVKLDNLIQIAHNVRIGAHTAIAACAGVAGSASIGRNCRIGGASGIAGHLTICDNVEVSTHTLITKSIDQPGTYTGAYPYEANREWRRNAAQLRHLKELADRVRALESALAARKRSET